MEKDQKMYSVMGIIFFILALSVLFIYRTFAANTLESIILWMALGLSTIGYFFFQAGGLFADFGFAEKYADVWQKIKKWMPLFFVLCLLAVILFIFWYAPGIDWLITDDHEIVDYLGPDKQLYASEIFSTYLSKTEIGIMGTFPRFRPVYYFLRVVETALWDGNLQYWYGFRIFLLMVSALIFWDVLRKWLGDGLSAVVILYTLTYTYWIDIFARLGPSESYAVFGAALMLWGGEKICRDDKLNKPYAWVLLSLGNVICVGSKENFIILLPVMIYFLYRYFRLKSRNVWVLVSLVVSILFSVFVMSVVIYAVQVSQQDIYHQSVLLSDRLQVFFSSIFTLHFLVLQLPLLIMFAAIPGMIFINRSIKKNQSIDILDEMHWNPIKGVIALILLYGSQLYFYNLNWPTGIRYDFPGLVVVPGLIVIFYLFVLQISKHFFPKGNQAGLGITISCVLLLLVLQNGYTFNRYNIQTRYIKSQMTMDTLHTLENLTAQYGEYPILIESEDIWAAEGFTSWPVYLRNYGIENQININLHVDENSGYTLESDLQLIENTRTIMSDGNEIIAPYSTFTADKDACISLCLSGYATPYCEINVQCQ